MPAVEKVEFVRLDASKFPEFKQFQGPSPYKSQSTDNPSYIKPKDRIGKREITGDLDADYGQFRTELTPLLGTEYSADAKLKDIINNPKQLRDLAITISERGVVFFRNQEDLTVQDQKKLIHELGVLTGKPKTSHLHVHPLAPANGVVHSGSGNLVDPEVTFISSRLEQTYLTNGKQGAALREGRRAAEGWHSDISFEPVPANYSSLRLVEPPENGSGGDTLWANGYALLEKFSPSFRQYLESLTGTFKQPRFEDYTEAHKFDPYTQSRGAPENVGSNFSAIHPLVRTNPVTGWKSLYVSGVHFTHINEVSPLESALIKKFIADTLAASHDIQLRFKWNKNDVAIWDNRSTLHTATYDYYGFAEREGIRTVGIAEIPYLDPKSTYQSESIKLSN